MGALSRALRRSTGLSAALCRRGSGAGAALGEQQRSALPRVGVQRPGKAVAQSLLQPALPPGQSALPARSFARREGLEQGAGRDPSAHRGTFLR